MRSLGMVVIFFEENITFPQSFIQTVAEWLHDIYGHSGLHKR